MAANDGPTTTKRPATVSLEEDNYDLSHKYWKIQTDKTIEGQGRPRHSLTREDSVTFDYFDEDGKTLLMKSVELNYIKKTLNLLLFGANPNLQQKETGDTALHKAVDTGNLVLVKLLLLFNADPTIRNKHYQEPLDIAEYMKQKTSESADIKSALKFTTVSIMSFGKATSPTDRTFKDDALDGDIDGIIEVLKEATRLQHKTKQYFSDHPTIPPSRNSTDTTYLLSIDGGGIRIFNVFQGMVNIENRMSQLTSKDEKMYTYFDYVGGTSAGGMGCCVMVYTEADAFNTRASILEGMFDVLKTPMEGRGEKMDTVLQEIFTEERAMSDLDQSSNPRVIITSSLADYTPYELHLMTNYGPPRDGQAGPRERKVWEACRLTSCAPMYFPVLRDLKLLDGGLVCNNPTLDCMAEIIDQGERENRPVKFGCVVSFGTGVPPKDESEEVEFFMPSVLSLLSFKNIQGLQNLLHHFMDQATLSDGREIAKAKSFCKTLGCEYFRLTPTMKKELPMDTDDEATLIDMLYNTQMYYLDNPELVDNVAKFLLSK